MAAKTLYDLLDNGDIPVPQAGAEPSATPAAVGASVPLAQSLYLTEPGDTAAISVNDLHQGQIGDCFLISSIGELALDHPAAIQNMIHSNSNGTETVTLYEASNGQLPSWYTLSFKAVSVTVTNSFPNYSVNNGSTQDVVGGQKEIWAQVLEKAVATLDGGYGNISNGGSPVIAMEELTGHAATWMSPSSLTLTTLQNDIKAGDLITFDTPNQSGFFFNVLWYNEFLIV